MEPPSDITRLLEDWNQGDSAALEKLFPLVYGELRRLASSYMRRERPDHTLQTTALVHEAYLKLVRQEKVRWQTRVHFYAVAAQVMRRVLIDHARGRGRAKRGDGQAALSLDEAAIVSDERIEDLLAVDEALTNLEAIDARKSRVFEMRYFGGMSMDETAEFLKISPATVTRDWRMAKAWLRREMTGR